MSTFMYLSTAGITISVIIYLHEFTVFMHIYPLYVSKVFSVAWFLILVNPPSQSGHPQHYISHCSVCHWARSSPCNWTKLEYWFSWQQSTVLREKRSACCCLPRSVSVSLKHKMCQSQFRLLLLQLLLTVTNVIKQPGDGQDTRGNDPGFNWLQLILLNNNKKKQGTCIISYLSLFIINVLFGALH